MKLDVVVIGLLNIDLIIRGTAPTDLETLLTWTGESEIECLTAGSVGYFIQNLAKLGVKTGIITTIADDSFSLIIKKTLTDAGVDISKLKSQKNTKSAIGIYMLLFGNKKRPMTFRMMTHDPMPTSFLDEDLEYIFNSRLLHIGGYLHFPQKELIGNLIKKAKNNGVQISMDPQFPLQPLDKPWLKAMPSLEDIDILFVDENEVLGLTNTTSITSAVKILLDKGIKIIAVKLGEKGCLVCNHSKLIQKPAIPVDNIIDSIGAGDSFDCGFVTGFLEGLSLNQMTNLALKVAASSLKGVGGSSSIRPRNAIILD
ncbi:MAG TPA: carbohydrate kinase family protein [Candidatus Deferrimicrobium sp.]|nr:carbohydrate kinase family protein [Candidatus Deferrimicrobium sp.]